MKVIVTGAAGFIGSHVCEYLLTKNFEVVGIDDFSSGHWRNLVSIASKIEFTEGDILNPTTVRRLKATIKGAQAIVHLAGVTSLSRAERNPEFSTTVNTLGTFKMLELARKHQIPRFVFASSSSVYGNNGLAPLDEEFPCSPVSLYGLGKMTAERYCHYFSRRYGIETVSLRFFNVYGPRLRMGEDASIIARIFSSTLEKIPVSIHGTGLQKRDFVHVSDVVQAIYQSLITSLKEKSPCLNIGSGESTSVLDLVRNCEQVTQQPLRYRLSAPLACDVYFSQANISRANKVLGFWPKVSLQDGLRTTWSYLQYAQESPWHTTLPCH